MPVAKKSKRALEKKIRSAIGRVYDPRDGKLIARSTSAVQKLVADVRRDYKKAEAARNRAARKRFGGAKKIETQRKYNADYQKSAKQAARLAKKLEKAELQARRVKVSVAEARPRAPKLPRVLEIGISYSAAKGIASDVNFNIRVRRKDGLGVTDEDADRALLAIAYGNANDMPDDLKVSAVDWARPSKVGRGGMYEKRDRDGDNAFSFSSIVATMIAGNLPFRVGEVKPDRIGL
jgi:ATPase subunit of ABC transporter with duplicated ATPase domains